MTVLVGQIVGSGVKGPAPDSKLQLWQINLNSQLATLGPTITEMVWAWLSAQRSPHTRAAYGRDLTEWLAFLSDHEVDPLAVTKGHGNVYGRSLEEVRGLSARSAGRKLAAVSSWYEYLVDEDIIVANRVKRTTRPKVDRNRSQTRSLSELEVDALLAAADTDYGAQALRTAALIRFMVDLGPRVSEVTGLCLGDLSYAEGFRTVQIVGKGGVVRIRNLPTGTARSVDVYLGERAAGVDPLFATYSGAPMQRQEVAVLVARVAGDAGVLDPRTVTPHVLRKTFATMAYRRGANVKDIQYALGHANSMTTDVYIRSSEELARDPSQLVAAGHR